MKRFTTILALLFTVGCGGASTSNKNSTDPGDLYSLQGPWTINAPPVINNLQVSLTPMQQTGGQCQGAGGYITDASTCYFAYVSTTVNGSPTGEATGSISSTAVTPYGSVDGVMIGSGLNGPVFIPEQNVQFSIIVETGNEGSPGYGLGCSYVGSGTITSGGQMSGTFTSASVIFQTIGQSCDPNGDTIPFTGTEQGTPSQNREKPAVTVTGRETRAYFR